MMNFELDELYRLSVAKLMGTIKLSIIRPGADHGIGADGLDFY
jgi:hypothetical protein